MTLALALLACAGPTPWTWELPPGFPLPVVPEDNPMTVEAVALGRRLFYDPQLSATGELSCASCHDPALAFTDGLPRSVGATGELHPRGAMPLANVAYLPRLTWANPHLDRLESHALLPLFGEEPVELGMVDREDELLARLAADPEAAALFEAAWPDDADPVTVQRLVQALASFQRSLLSGGSPYDRFLQGEREALSEEAQAGLELFFGERLGCSGCHRGFTFSDSVVHEGLDAPELAFHNTGLYNLDGEGAYPADNTGLFAFTGEPADLGRFRTPSLRNVALTAPYFHDGSALSLDEVLDHYAAGGRTLREGPYAGVGSESPLRSERVTGFALSEAERAQVLAFLEALSDEAFLSEPAFADPFAG